MSKNIYLARQEGSEMYKIGISKKNPLKRIKELQTGNAAELELVHQFVTNHDFKMESCLHAHFSTKKVMGEWFLLTEQDVDSFLQECQSKEDLMDLLKKTNHFWGE